MSAVTAARSAEGVIVSNGVPEAVQGPWPEHLITHRVNLTPEVGKKYDSGKMRWSLLLSGCRLALRGALRVLQLGAVKYGENNWQHVTPHSRYVEALHRHMDAIHERGLTARDPETGELEAHHVLTNALFLSHFAEREARPEARVSPVEAGTRVLPDVPAAPANAGNLATGNEVWHYCPTGAVPRREAGIVAVTAGRAVIREG
jgi:Domain of unknown function (DUF5664)